MKSVEDRVPDIACLAEEAILSGIADLSTAGRRTHARAVLSAAYQRLLASVCGTITRQEAEQLLANASTRLIQSGEIAAPADVWQNWSIRVKDEKRNGATQMIPTCGDCAGIRILFLAANPTQTSALDLEEELRSLEQELRGVKFRDSITLTARHAVRPDDLIRHVRADRPNVVHFSGHGSTAGILLRNDKGGYQAVEGTSLKRFFEGRGVDLVVLNACYSKGQADTIRDAVRTVVGTTDAVGDEAARRFTVAFYRALGDGLPIGEAFRDGGDAVALHGLVDVFYSAGDLELSPMSQLKSE